ncbi:terminase small subunit [Pseudomonas sp. RTC3]|uniref:terminase small subunit n=1 Tax=unclassified Pseudomonas TaxID=196821 RepID=UPI002AB4AEBC|nr:MULTISPECIES: terminase small subunit [unclassified Pseudomonas]MEB0062466.1 terminase small subunit [Pseudomonas sp. RTC3]MDY7565797.1 terminase small subunit [Pseudomonas sp. 5C2]MEB0027586.1 terminase small subunit [Pseudomonas sp. MH9.2]MEB0240471.1 terminase small subunit [Pseudomonas sp. 5C2]WPX70356.1 terminase small subunit [Pseudomonas sp. MH9.2]
MALTDKKRRFADALLSGVSKSQAAIDAGYSVKTAPQAGSKLFKDQDVTGYLQRRSAPNAPPQKVKSEVKKVKSEVEKVNLDDALTLDAPTFDSRALLERIARDNEQLNPELAAKIALGLMPYDHPKKADFGKKDAKEADAQKAAKGRFGQSSPPPIQLRSVK